MLVSGLGLFGSSGMTLLALAMILIASVIIFAPTTYSLIFGLGAILNHGEDRNRCGTDAVDEAKLRCDSFILQNDPFRY